MNSSQAVRGGVVALALSVVFTGCQRTTPTTSAPVPSPRYPHYLVTTDVGHMMDAARMAVRQPYGRSPLGKMQSGQTVHVITTYGQDPQVWEAIRRAWEERGVKAIAVGSWELLGLTEEQYTAQVKQNLLFGNEAWQEMGVFRPVYQSFFPPDVQAQFKRAFTSEVVRKDIGKFLDKRPDIEHYFAGTGGGGFWERAAGERHAGKFVGNWIYVTALELVGKSSTFPGDVWNMIDDKIVRPIPHVAEGIITDLQGTRMHWAQTADQRVRWGKRTGENNHLNIYPSPAEAIWEEGVIRANANHTGFYPTMTVTLSRHGRVDTIEGGGKFGDLFRMLLDNPKLHDAKYPTAPESGYWFLSQDGFATNPKFVRDTQGLREGTVNIANLSERNRAGAQHFSFSYPSSTLGTPEDKRDADYAAREGLPNDHTAHMHVYFTTVKWKMADTGEWITISENGNVKAFEDPEVRALAARYGDPALIFRYEWVPGIPGINAPGDEQKDYGADPWTWIMQEWAEIQKGTYAHFVEDYQMKPVTAQGTSN